MMKLNPGTREGDRQNFQIRPTLMDGADRATTDFAQLCD
jgi:hypothetical protein